MRRSIWAVVAGLALAVLAAALAAKIFGVPLAEERSGELPLWHLLRSCLPIATYILPGALTAILLAEARRIRGLPFWLAVGALLGALAFFTLVHGGHALEAVYLTSKKFLSLLTMGLLGGLFYWMIAGKKSGHLATALDYAGRGEGLDEHGLRKRCRWCFVTALLFGLLPLALLGWHMIYRPDPMLPASITAKAEIDGTQKLVDAGLTSAKLTIDNHIGRVTGTVADDTARASTFESAKTVLAPMVGIPGVVAVLQNDIVVSGSGLPASPAAALPAAEDVAAKAKAGGDAKRQAEERRLAEEAKRKAEEIRLAEEAKRKADEEAAAKAKANAEEEVRLAAEVKRKADEVAAKAKAEEEVRLAAEAKRKADEEAAAKAKAKAKAEEEVRVAAEVKRKADEVAAKAKAAEDARLAAEAKQRAEDQKRLEDELAAQKKADEAVRVAAEAEAERKAVEAAHKVEAEKLAAEAEAKRQADAMAAAKKLAEAQEKPAVVLPPVPAPVPAPQAASPLPAPNALCPGDFSELFKSGSVRFALRSSEIDSAAAEFLDRVAAVAKRCAGYSLSIGGHADRSGADSYNQQLSFERAVAVQDALVARGIAAERMEPDGYSSQRPYDPSISRSAYRLNRRVDLGASLTPAAKMPAKAADAMPAAAAVPEVKTATPPPALPADQCNGEFSRAFLADTVRFVGSSAIVDDSYADYLDHIATLAKSCPSHKLILGGHTDRRGAAAFNQKLSDERANAVRDALIDRDVPEGRISAAGYGGERPYDPGNSPEAYALNRRVDFGVAVQAH
jgi:outer membrane protein OmpA-like peptidoglycan-associated protein